MARLPYQLSAGHPEAGVAGSVRERGRYLAPDSLRPGPPANGRASVRKCVLPRVRRLDPLDAGTKDPAEFEEHHVDLIQIVTMSHDQRGRDGTPL